MPVVLDLDRYDVIRSGYGLEYHQSSINTSI